MIFVGLFVGMFCFCPLLLPLLWVEFILGTRFSLAAIIYFSKLRCLQFAVYVERMKYELTVEQGLQGSKPIVGDEDIREKQQCISAMFEDVGKYMIAKGMTHRNKELTETPNVLPFLHSLDYACNISKKANKLTPASAKTDNAVSDTLVLNDIFTTDSMIIIWDIFLCLVVSHAIFALLAVLVIVLHFQSVTFLINQNFIWAYGLEKEAIIYKTNHPYSTSFNFDFNEHYYLVNMEKACYHYFVVRYLYSICDDWMGQIIVQFLYRSILEWPVSEQSKDASDQIWSSAFPNQAQPIVHSEQDSDDSESLSMKKSTHNRQLEFAGDKANIARLIQAILEL
ncbi:hypothetical protein RFI_32747 [Reticulomyxa filosa]|uniref:Uncharacterized protein n=1 Tax=Reticulomyxa filosa TaxID=46433 RepID=X6LRX0_RETFI|nr:hypothetical protein RFI_32747 [Reticulomyxa filosa]|eukprot:ETO04648.1 hypothetical protein RFI_32747 [Reticulomyxa filosa]